MKTLIALLALSALTAVAQQTVTKPAPSRPAVPSQPPAVNSQPPQVNTPPPQVNTPPPANNTPAAVPVTPVPGANSQVVQPGIQPGGVNQNQVVVPGSAINPNVQPSVNQSVQGAFTSQQPYAGQTYNQTPVPTNSSMNGYQYSSIPTNPAARMPWLTNSPNWNKNGMTNGVPPMQ